MASSKLLKSADGKKFYEISVYRGKGLAYYKKRWYVPDGWSSKAIAKQLKKEEMLFEEACKNGEYRNKQETKEALEKAKQIEMSIDTVKSYGENVFMRTKKIQCSEKTREYYQSKLDQYIYPAIGDMKLPDVKAIHINEIILCMQEKNLAYSTVRGVFVTLNQLFKMAYNADLIPIFPTLKANKPKHLKREVIKESIPAFTAEELNYIQSCLENEELQWKVYFILMIYTGCREGELCGLKWDSVDFDNNTIRIENNLCYTPAKGIYDDSPKTRSIRTICIPDFVIELLAQWSSVIDEEIINRKKRLIKDRKPLDVKKLTRSEYVFHQKGTNLPMHPQSPTRFFRKFGKKYKIDDCHPHKLRHSFASVAISNKADILSVSGILGHSDPSVTLKMYSHANKESMKATSDLFATVLSTKSKKKEAK